MKNFVPWAVLVSTLIAGPYIYGFVQAYWSLLLVPTLLAVGAKATLSVLVIMTLFNVVGALFGAALLSLPIGFVLRSRAWIYGAVVGCVVAATLVIWLYPLDLSLFSLVHLIAESLALVVGCTLFTALVSRHQRQRRAA